MSLNGGEGRRGKGMHSSLASRQHIDYTHRVYTVEEWWSTLCKRTAQNLPRTKGTCRISDSNHDNHCLVSSQNSCFPHRSTSTGCPPCLAL